MVAFLLSCKSSADYSKGKSKTADPEAPGPHPSPPPGRMKNDARSKGPTETRFSQSLQLNKIQVSEAPVLLEGLHTAARNAEIRGCSTIWPPLTNPGQKHPNKTLWQRSETTAQTTFFQEKGKAGLPDHSEAGRSTAPGSSHWRWEHPTPGKGKGPVSAISTAQPHPPPISR